MAEQAVYVVTRHMPLAYPSFEVVAVRASLKSALDKRRAKARGMAGEWREIEPDQRWTTRSERYNDALYSWYEVTKKIVE